MRLRPKEIIKRKTRQRDDLTGNGESGILKEHFCSRRLGSVFALPASTGTTMKLLPHSTPPLYSQILVRMVVFPSLKVVYLLPRTAVCLAMNPSYTSYRDSGQDFPVTQCFIDTRILLHTAAVHIK